MSIKYTQAYFPPTEEMINFTIGYPETSSLPLDLLRKATAAKLDDEDKTFLHYAIPSGFKEYRESLAKFLTRHYNTFVDPNSLVTMNGATGGLDFFCKLFTSPNDVILTEDPTYFLAYPLFKDFHLKVVEVSMDEDGVNLVDFEEKLNIFKPSAFYTIPISQNPTGRTTSIEKRKKLVELAYKYNFKIISDEVYHLLSFTEDIPLPFFYYDYKEPHDHIITVGSFSKILCPAARLGWIECGKPIRDALAASGLFLSGGCVNPIMCGVLWKAIELGLMDEHLHKARELLITKSKNMMNALNEYVPSLKYEIPRGGYFILAKIPEQFDVDEFIDECFKKRVSFLSGKTFGSNFDRYIRLCFAFYTPEDIITGIKRIAEAVKSLEERQNKK